MLYTESYEQIIARKSGGNHDLLVCEFGELLKDLRENLTDLNERTKAKIE